MNKSLKDLQQQAMGESKARFERTFLDCKNASFSWWDKETKERKYTKAPIVGLIMGEAMHLEVFSTREQKFYRSDYYSDNSRVKLFAPDGSLAIESDLKSVANYAVSKLGSSPKKKKVLWIATENGVIELRSNLVLAIDQLKNVTRDERMNFLYQFTPHLYDPADPEISATAKEYLGKIAAKQPPSFFKMTKFEPVTDTIDQNSRLKDKLSAFIEWQNNQKSSVAAKPVTNTPEPDAFPLDDVFDSTDGLPI